MKFSSRVVVPLFLFFALACSANSDTQRTPWKSNGIREEKGTNEKTATASPSASAPSSRIYKVPVVTWKPVVPPWQAAEKQRDVQARAVAKKDEKKRALVKTAVLRTLFFPLYIHAGKERIHHKLSSLATSF
jgi:hypothetical protein